MIRIKKETVISALALILTILIIAVIISAAGIGTIQYEDITDTGVGRITDENGTPEAAGLDHTDWILDPNETLTVDLRLPEEAPFDSADDLVFFVYNADVKVSCGDRVLADNGGEEIAAQGNLIGNSRIVAEIPPDAWGDTLQIQITSYEKRKDSFNEQLLLVPASEARFVPLISDSLQIILFTIISVISLAVSIRYLLEWIFMKSLNPGLFLFTLLMSQWYLGYHRAPYILLSSQRFNACMEYYTLYLALIPLEIYFAVTTADAKFRRISMILCAAFAADAAVSIAVTVSPLRYNLADLIQINRALTIVAALACIARGFSMRKMKMTNEKIVLTGIAAGTFVAALEIAAILLRVAALPEWIQPVLYFDYASLGLLVFIGIMYVNHFARLQNEQQMRIRQEELSRLAYVDPLTGIPNRACLVYKMQKFGELPEGFTAVFMDVDRLKRANDDFGHETGDELIASVGQQVQSSYLKAGGTEDLYGRWGGDEFIAFFPNREMADVFEDCLYEGINSLNRKRIFSFEVTVSVGEATGNTKADGSKRTAQELLDLADKRMYERKAERHAMEEASEI